MNLHITFKTFMSWIIILELYHSTCKANPSYVITTGVIVYCGMEEAFANYPMFEESLDSLIIDQYMVYSWQKSSLLTEAESKRAPAAPVPGLK